MEKYPKIFVSYSHDTNEHKQWVKKLSSDLRMNGVDVVLDQWDLRIGEDLRFFMEKGLNDSALVLCICSDKYVTKFDAGAGGVGYESTIMTHSLLSNANLGFIIPIIRNNLETSKTPQALSSKSYIDFSDDDQYHEKYIELLTRIYDEDLTKKPQLGENPFSKGHLNFISNKFETEQVNFHNLSFDGTVTFDYSNNNNNYIIGSGEYSFVTHWSSSGTGSIHAYNDFVEKIGYIPNYKEIPKEISDLKNFNYSSRTRTVYVDEVVVWINIYGHFAVTQIKEVLARSDGSQRDEITFDYKIYKL